VAELAYAPDLGSGSCKRIVGSSPILSTIINKIVIFMHNISKKVFCLVVL